MPGLTGWSGWKANDPDSTIQAVADSSGGHWTAGQLKNDPYGFHRMMFENWSDERLTDLYHKMQDSPGTNALPGGSLPLFIREVRKMSLGDIIWRPRPGEMEKSPNNP